MVCTRPHGCPRQKLQKAFSERNPMAWWHSDALGCARSPPPGHVLTHAMPLAAFSPHGQLPASPQALPAGPGSPPPSLPAPTHPHSQSSSQDPPPSPRQTAGMRGLAKHTPVNNNPSKLTEGLGDIKVIVCSKAPVRLLESLIYGRKFRL